MPKSKKTTAKRGNKKKSFFSQIKWDDSYVSLLIGIIVVVVIAGLGIFIVKSQKTTQTSSTQFDPSLQIQDNATLNGNDQTSKRTYTVKSGDDLWKISEKFYKSGYNWVDIVKANNLDNPGMIFAGNKLTIPDVEAKTVTVSIEQKQDTNKSIAGNSYTVEEGDSLWDIAVRAYGDGYSWTRIEQANDLSDPNLIFSGNVLKIPR